MNVSTPSIVHTAQTPKRVSTTTFLDNYTAAFERAYPGVPMIIRRGKGGYRVIIRGEWTQEDVPMTIDQIIEATHDLTKGQPTIQ
jgi:hypothetical protein